MRSVYVSAAFALVLLGSGSQAHAGIAWGDATLKADDVRVEIDSRGQAIVTHRIGIHVAAKRFRAFVVDGVDDHAEAPLDEATTAGLDGPGWPITVVDSKASPNDAPIEAFVEPAKEPRRLRVHLGRDGVPRGDYLLELRYRVDLAAQGSFVRDGARVRFTWEAPSWPEGFDSGHLVFVLPAAPSEPQIAIADIGGGPARSVDGVAIVDLARSATDDAMTLTRPHVPHHDDARWVLTFDAKATPELATKLPIGVRTETTTPPDPPRGLRYWCWSCAIALLTAGVAFFAMRRRDLDAERACERRGLRARSLLAIGARWRATLFSSLIGGALILSLSRMFIASAATLVMAMVVSVLRAPRSSAPVAAAGRWLAMPRQAIPQRPPTTAAPFDASTWLGRIVVAASLLACFSTCTLIARHHLDVAAIFAMHATALFSLFVTGRSTQLPPDLAFDAWPRLASIFRALQKKHGARLKVMGHVPRRAEEGEAKPTMARRIDEVRLRIDPTTEASAHGLLAIEIGCAIVSGLGASALVPELLVRVRQGGLAARALEKRIGRARASSTFQTSLGRTSDETVVAIRPVLTGASSVRHWVEWILRTVLDGAIGDAVIPTTEPRRSVTCSPEREPNREGANAPRPEATRPIASL